MFARVSRFQGSPELAQRAAGGTVPPEVQRLPGFKGAYSLLNRATGQAMLITLWESEVAMRASTEVANQVRARTVQEAGSTAPASVEVYEVISHP